jgi:hypothetical protein
MLTTLAFRTEEENFVLSLALYQTTTMFKTLFFALTAAAVAPAAIAQSFNPTLPPADFPAGKNRWELETFRSFLLCETAVATSLWSIRQSVSSSIFAPYLFMITNF